MKKKKLSLNGIESRSGELGLHLEKNFHKPKNMTLKALVYNFMDFS
jgi:hypothetical protein